MKNIFAAAASGAFALKRPMAVVDPSETPLLAEVLTAAGAAVSPSAQAKVRVNIVGEIPGAFNHRLADFPAEGGFYNLSTPLRGNRFVSDVNGKITATTFQIPAASSALPSATTGASRSASPPWPRQPPVPPGSTTFRAGALPPPCAESTSPAATKSWSAKFHSSDKKQRRPSEIRAASV